MKQGIVFSVIGVLVFGLCCTVNAGRAPSHFMGSTNHEYGASVREILETTDGDFIVVGDLRDDYSCDNTMITKYRSDGALVWTSDIYDEDDNSARDIVELSDGGVAVVGEWENYSGSESFGILIKFHSTGPAIWGRQIGNEEEYVEFSSIANTVDGGIVVAGEYEYQYGLIVKFNNQGDLLWQKLITLSFHDLECKSIIETSDGGLAVLVELEENLDAFEKTAVIKLTATGNIEWSQAFSGTTDVDPDSFCQTSDGGFAIVGKTEIVDPNGDAFLIKTDDVGSLEYAWNISGQYEERYKTLFQSSDGHYVLGGFSSNWNTSSGYSSLLKIDVSTGNSVWARKWGTQEGEYITGISECFDGGIAFCGRTDLNLIGGVLIGKTEHDGTIQGCTAITDDVPVISALTLTSETPSFSIDTSSLPDDDHRVWVRMAQPENESICFHDPAPTTPTPTPTVNPEDVNAGIVLYGTDNDEWVRDAVKTSDGGFIVAGGTGTYPDYDIQLTKFQDYQTIDWSHRFNSSGRDSTEDILQLSDDSYVVSGILNGDRNNIGLVHVSASGSVINANHCIFSSEAYLNGLSSASDGGIWGVGSLELPDDANNALVIKYDSPSVIGSAFTYDYGARDSASRLIEKPTGGVYVCGYARSYDPTVRKIFVASLDTDGSHLWTKTLETLDYLYLAGICITSDGGVMVAGDGDPVSVGDQNSIFLFKFDASGNPVFSREFGGDDYDDFRSITRTSDSAYMLAGSTNSCCFADDDMFMLKVDETGSILWQAVAGGYTELEVDGRGFENADGSFCLVGTCEYELSFSSDIAVVQTDAEGQIRDCPWFVPYTFDDATLSTTWVSETPTVSGISASFQNITLTETPVYLNQKYYCADTTVCIHHGDVNFSGQLTAQDAQTTFFFVLGLQTPTYSEECAADCDDSGSITAGDAQEIFLAVLGTGTGCAETIP